MIDVGIFLVPNDEKRSGRDLVDTYNFRQCLSTAAIGETNVSTIRVDTEAVPAVRAVVIFAFAVPLRRLLYRGKISPPQGGRHMFTLRASKFEVRIATNIVN
jgi:hypothetical protein